MALLHQVYDTDAHFKVDPISRTIRNSSSGKTVLIQYDHNSERFTFEIPRQIDGHDMSKCNQVEVHYINISSEDKTKTSCGVYIVDDLQISPDGDDVVICSWLISQNATTYAGALNFLLKFKCVEDGHVLYRWHTAIFSQISVSSGIENGEIKYDDYVDVLSQWESRIAAVEKGFKNLQSSIPDVSGFAKKTEIPDVSGFAKRSELPTVPTKVSAFQNDAGYLTQHQSLEGYAKKTDIPDVSGFATMGAVEQKGYQTADQVNALINTAISNIPVYAGEVEDV